MSRLALPLQTSDLSAFARALALQLQAKPAPGHLELLNMLARAGGFRNLQHLRAAAAAKSRLDAARTTAQTAAQTDHSLVERALRHFDEQGRLARWPSRRNLQILCLWALWPLFPLGSGLHERQVNALLAPAHGFGDPALLRRDMTGLGLLARSPDGTAYHRNRLAPPPEARALIHHVTTRRKGAAPVA
ncbi:DUF2087 domain-containing protein [Paragemmobacter straminiformis]|uniref:DUF2087 domain-containing protein n=1 Tax=Paragemmobacter straminiformis TaxID=2045119 RepID=A0A842IBP5_9RHOB|nr:DUF2087 domain-containing protein [Gemmobacter straminiformis]MBC2837105.1 DUF2087 domain-containing protein [Gemmobacter straminiformis]